MTVSSVESALGEKCFRTSWIYFIRTHHNPNTAARPLLVTLKIEFSFSPRRNNEWRKGDIFGNGIGGTGPSRAGKGVSLQLM